MVQGAECKAHSFTGNAKVFGFEAGAGLSGNQFNIVSTVFYPTYIVFDVFWVVATKRFGADKTLAVALTGWGVTTLGTTVMELSNQDLLCIAAESQRQKKKRGTLSELA
jgi:hypothetical protein